MQRNNIRKNTVRIAFSGMIASLSIVLLMLGGIIPVATYAVPLFCGLLLLPVCIEINARTAWITFTAVSCLVLFLGFDKEAALFYILFGSWPLLKLKLDQIKSKPIRMLVKLAYINIALVVVYGILIFVFNIQSVLDEFKTAGIIINVCFVILFNVCMLIYDKLTLIMAGVYLSKFHDRVKKLFQ